MFNKIKKAGLIIWAVVASFFAILGYLLLHYKKQKNTSVIEEAQNAKETTQQKIKDTPADELVNNASNADDLCGERNAIIEQFRAEVRNRLNKKLHGDGCNSTD